MSTDVIKADLTDEFVLKGITDFESATAALSAAGITDIEIIGDGFYPLDKNDLVNRPFLVITMKLVNGDFDGDMCVMHIVTKTDVTGVNGEPTRKGLIVDGGLGIREQARRYIAAGRSEGLLCERGLVRSDYEANEVRPAGTTYYLS